MTENEPKMNLRASETCYRRAWFDGIGHEAVESTTERNRNVMRLGQAAEQAVIEWLREDLKHIVDPHPQQHELQHMIGDVNLTGHPDAWISPKGTVRANLLEIKTARSTRYTEAVNALESGTLEPGTTAYGWVRQLRRYAALALCNLEQVLMVMQNTNVMRIATGFRDSQDEYDIDLWDGYIAVLNRDNGEAALVKVPLFDRAAAPPIWYWYRQVDDPGMSVWEHFLHIESDHLDTAEPPQRDPGFNPYAPPCVGCRYAHRCYPNSQPEMYSDSIGDAYERAMRLEERAAALKDDVRERAMRAMTQNEVKVLEIGDFRANLITPTKPTISIDRDAMRADGVYEDYAREGKVREPYLQIRRIK